MGDAGEGNSKWGENFGEVVRRGFPFHIGTECEDYFGRTAFFDSTKKRFDAELLGTDVVERREASAQGVVKAAKNAAAFEREDVGRLLHNAEFLALARGLRADAAQFFFREKSALATRMDRRRSRADGLGELRWACVFVTEQPKRAAFRTAWP